MNKEELEKLVDFWKTSSNNYKRKYENIVEDYNEIRQDLRRLEAVNKELEYAVSLIKREL